MKIKKYIIIGIIIGVAISGSISVIAATYFPSKDTTYDNSSSGLQSSNVQDAIDELYGMCFPKFGSDTIINLVNTNPDELYKDDHGDIRYYGASPNNYVTFNNELWRIIGVIDEKIKIIRNESIGKKAWASNGRNNWNNSDLKSYLNGNYYNSINSTSQNMISEETFYLGGPTNSNFSELTASGFYDAERSNSVYSGNPTTTTQSIGLMYPSDYGYASGSSCLSTALFNYSSCKNSNWLFSGENEWLQAPDATYYDRANSLSSFGYINTDCMVESPSYYAVRPVLYLKSETKITGGDGSQSNPFELSL